MGFPLPARTRCRCGVSGAPSRASRLYTTGLSSFSIRALSRPACHHPRRRQHKSYCALPGHPPRFRIPRQYATIIPGSLQYALACTVSYCVQGHAPPGRRLQPSTAQATEHPKINCAIPVRMPTGALSALQTFDACGALRITCLSRFISATERDAVSLPGRGRATKLAPFRSAALMNLDLLTSKHRDRRPGVHSMTGYVPGNTTPTPSSLCA